jgi:methenyltetrahydromethanopterin cyclohydrolase
MISLNARSHEIAEKMVAQAEALNIIVEKPAWGTTLIDTGINVSGSFEAGRLFSEICMAGLGKVAFSTLEYGDFALPCVNVTVSHPVEACMASQYAGWAIEVPKKNKKTFFAMGSGPARALYGKEKLLQKLGIQDKSDVAVLTLETRKLPDEEVCLWVAEKCGVSPDHLIILAAPTASLVGSIQIAARVIETGLHKMENLDFDIRTILSGFGVCPIPPLDKDDLRAIGRTNDAVLYGGKVWYTAKADPGKIEKIIEQLPSSASKDYGTPFYDLFQRYDCDFYKIDPLLFSPAEVYINNISNGRTYHSGEVNPNILKKSMGT